MGKLVYFCNPAAAKLPGRDAKWWNGRGVDILLVPGPTLLQHPVTEADLLAYWKPIVDATGGMPVWAGQGHCYYRPVYDAQGRLQAPVVESYYPWDAGALWDRLNANCAVHAEVMRKLAVGCTLWDWEFYDVKPGGTLPRDRAWRGGPGGLIARRAQALKQAFGAHPVGCYTRHVNNMALTAGYRHFALGFNPDLVLIQDTYLDLTTHWSRWGHGVPRIYGRGAQVVGGWYPHPKNSTVWGQQAGNHRRGCNINGYAWVYPHGDLWTDAYRTASAAELTTHLLTIRTGR